MYYCRCVCLAETVGAHSICARAVRGGGSIPRADRESAPAKHFFASTRYYRTAMHSISTSAPFGSAAICTQLRAGKPPWK